MTALRFGVQSSYTPADHALGDLDKLQYGIVGNI